MKKSTSFLLAPFIIFSILLTGCDDYRELEGLSIIAGVAIDKDKQGKYIFTAEIVNPSEAGKETIIQSKLIETSGDTIVDTARNLINIVSPRPFWGQTQIVIISQEVAKEGIIDIVDAIYRNRESRLNIDFLVSKDKTAKEVLEAKSITTGVHSYEIRKILEEEMRYLSKAYRTRVYQFVNDLTGEGISPVLPAIRISQNQGGKSAEVFGNAVFQKDKLIGFLNRDESNSLLFIRNKVKNGTITLKEPRGNGLANLTLVIKDNKTKVKPVYSNGEVSMNVQVKTVVELSEYGALGSSLDQKNILTLEHKAEEKLKGNIENVIRKVQNDYAADIFGFGSTIYEQMPSLWKEIKPNWNNVFKSLHVNVSVNIEIKESGLLSKTIKVGD